MPLCSKLDMEIPQARCRENVQGAPSKVNFWEISHVPQQPTSWSNPNTRRTYYASTLVSKCAPEYVLPLNDEQKQNQTQIILN